MLNSSKNIVLQKLEKPQLVQARHEIFLLFILAIATFALFSPTLCYSLLNGWDDHIYVTNVVSQLNFSFQNLQFWFTHPHHGCYLPFTMVSYMVDYLFYGLNGGGYHLQNILWHIVAVLAVFKCFRVLNIKLGLAFVMALFFAIHPQRIESVAWISERKDVICAAFYFWSVFFFLKSAKFDKWYCFSFICFILSFLSKPMAVSIPFVLFFLSYLSTGSWNWKNQLKRVAPFALLVLLLAPLTYFAHVKMGSVASQRIDTWRQFFVIAYNVMWYTVSNFFPVRLSPIYPKVVFDNRTIVYLLSFFSTVVAIFAYLYFKKRKILISSVLPLTICYLVALLPVVGVIPFGFIDFADRYSYIPSFFLCIGTGLILQWSLNGLKQLQDLRRVRAIQRGLILFVCCYFVIFTVTDLYYMRAWKSIYQLHKMSMTQSTPNIEAVKFLADLELEKGDLSEALKLADIIVGYRADWMSANDILVNQLKAEYIRSVVAYQIGKQSVGFEIMKRIRSPYAKLANSQANQRAVADYKTILLHLATSYEQIGKEKESTICYEEFLTYLQPGDPDRLFYRGVVLMRHKHYSEAKRIFKQAFAADPGDKELQRLIRLCSEHL